MNELLPILRREFSEFDAIHAFEAGIPVYFVRLEIEVLEPQKLTSFQMYFLHAIAYGVNTRATIAHLLGVDERDLVSPGASLLKIGYIEQGLPTREKERLIELTDRGRQALQENGVPPVPKRKVGRFHFNALTWAPIPQEEKTWSIEQMGKEGLFILPAKGRQRPTLGDFSEKDVAFALSDAPAFQGNDVIALLQLKKVELEYIATVTVVLLQHRETGEQRLAAYRNSIQQRPESTVLQRLFENRELKLPADAASLKERDLDAPLPLSSEVTQATQDLVQNEYDLKDLEVQLAEQEALQSTTQNERERRELEERVQQLKDELRIKREDNEGLRQKLRQNQVEFLRTEQHRPILEQALREAREEIIIISPWMNRRACNDHLCRLIGDAIARGVRVRIGHGMGRERDAAEAARNRANVQLVRGALGRYIPKPHADLLEMRETSGTHQKILVCDRTFAVTGSFNWLSYSGQQDEGYRNETGTLFRHVEQVTELANIALQVLLS